MLTDRGLRKVNCEQYTDHSSSDVTLLFQHLPQGLNKTPDDGCNFSDKKQTCLAVAICTATRRTGMTMLKRTCNDTRKPEIHTPIWLDSIMRSDIHKVTACGRCFTELGIIYHRVSLVTFKSLYPQKAATQQCAFNPLKPNDAYIGRTAPLTSRRCILYIYSTNICTEYFKHAAHSPFFPLQNAIYFIMLPCLVHV